VERGKPDPLPYVRGAELLGLHPAEWHCGGRCASVSVRVWLQVAVCWACLERMRRGVEWGGVVCAVAENFSAISSKDGWSYGSRRFDLAPRQQNLLDLFQIVFRVDADCVVIDRLSVEIDAVFEEAELFQPLRISRVRCGSVGKR